MENKVYVLISHWDLAGEHDGECLGVYTDKEIAKEELRLYVENNILHEHHGYQEDECWYNEDHSCFTAYNERNKDCEWVVVEEIEFDKRGNYET